MEAGDGKTASDREALELAKSMARDRMLEDPSKANVAAFETARAALEKLEAPEPPPTKKSVVYGSRIEALRQLQGQGYSISKTKFYADCKAGICTLDDEGKISSEDLQHYIERAGIEKMMVFPNRVIALERLQADGYKIKKSKFYRDCKLGLCRLQPDGAVTEYELYLYARRVGLERLLDLATDPATETLAKKNEKEVERLEEQIAKLRRQREIEEGRYMPRELVEMEMAGKCAALEAGLRHLFHTRLQDWIETAGAHGMPAALDAAQQDLNAQFDEFASLDGFNVLIGDGY